MIKKNDKKVVDIISYGYNGEGIAKIDGMVVFVPYAMQGEQCEILILKVEKTKAYAKLLRVLKHNPYRVEPRCPYFTKCGGCQLQHIEYNESLLLKTKWVSDNMKNIGKLDVVVNTTIGSEPYYEYRNKIALPVDKTTRRVGLFANNSHRVVPIEDCVIQGDWARDVINICNKFIDLSGITIYDELTGEGVLRHFVARYNNDCLLMTIVVNSKTFRYKDLIDDLVASHFDNYGIDFNVNMARSNVILSNEFHHISGVSCIPMKDNGIEYNITNASFLQVNNFIKDKIYSKVLDNIASDDVVIDAYSGAGLLTAMVAKNCKKAYGIEIVSPAVDSANALKESNKVYNMQNICGDCAEELPKLISIINDKCVVILDPPRKGCDDKVIYAISKALPHKIIYISCDHATLARDLHNLMTYTNNGYIVNEVQPYDMFPQTKHVETVVCMERKG